MAQLSLGTMMQIGWRLITYRAEIEKLIPRLTKAMDEITRLVPEVNALAKKIAPEFFGAPDAAPVYDVAWVQRTLKTLGFDPGAIDGIMGERTKAAIEGFQRTYGLKVDGWAGSATLAKLDELSRPRRV